MWETALSGVQGLIDGRGTGLYTSLPFVRRCRGRIYVDPLYDLARSLVVRRRVPGGRDGGAISEGT